MVKCVRTRASARGWLRRALRSSLCLSHSASAVVVAELVSLSL
jgi:hypothetical protein